MIISARASSVEQRLLRIQNFSGVFAVVSSLHSFPVSRLKRTWKVCPCVSFAQKSSFFHAQIA